MLKNGERVKKSLYAKITNLGMNKTNTQEKIVQKAQTKPENYLNWGQGSVF